jgi:hypothetical protein
MSLPLSTTNILLFLFLVLLHTVHSFQFYHSRASISIVQRKLQPIVQRKLQPKVNYYTAQTNKMEVMMANVDGHIKTDRVEKASIEVYSTLGKIDASICKNENP